MLLALDFAGDVVEVVSQPPKISFAPCGKRRFHTPHYLVVTHRGGLADRRTPRAPDQGAGPEVVHRGRRRLRLALGGGRSLARACVRGPGRDGVAAPAEVRFAGAAAGAARRGGGERRLGELAAATGCEPVARAQFVHLLHLLWSQQLGVDLAGPLQDRSLVMPTGEAGR